LNAVRTSPTNPSVKVWGIKRRPVSPYQVQKAVFTPDAPPGTRAIFPTMSKPKQLIANELVKRWRISAEELLIAYLECDSVAAFQNVLSGQVLPRLEMWMGQVGFKVNGEQWVDLEKRVKEKRCTLRIDTYRRPS
jgi:hypothetical protein